MGQERDCKLRYGGKVVAGKAYLETDYLLFRGEQRLKLCFNELTGVEVDDGVLRLDFAGGPAAVELGADAAKWARKILHPPSRLDKLGVRPGTKLRVIGTLEPDFLKEVAAGGAILTGSAPDLVFLAAEKSADLRRIPKPEAGLPAGAALWVVFPKGGVGIREMEVIEAGRAAGLKDTKVARFSSSHTALRFAPPRAR
jgi:hypothetical protein